MIRCDDYPAGIRPIQKGQLDMFDRMIELLPTIHLGIVPRTYLKFDCHLKKPNIIPCMHGVHHGYDKYSQILMNANDWCNHDTVNVFYEFEHDCYESIQHGLLFSKQYLEQEFGCVVDTYIPCCNVITTELANMIHHAGFTRILCENTCESPIPIIRSGFYGKLENLNAKHDVVTIHLPWEWDTVREKGFDYWVELVKTKIDANFI